LVLETFTQNLFLWLQAVIAIGKLRHAIGHDGFHNIEREKRWRNWPARVRSHHRRYHE
ncbi:hypothetical protein KR059_006001, partial [Drosophila kikkawai]